MTITVDMYAYALKCGFQINIINNLLSSDYRTCVVDSNSHFIITPSGELVKCGESYEPDDPGLVGKILEDGQMQIDVGKMAKWTKDPFAYPECLDCVHLPTCMGGCVMKRVTRTDNFCTWEYKEHFTDILELLYDVISRYNEGNLHENV